MPRDHSGIQDIELRPLGAPPPAPPRSFLAERGEFDRVTVGFCARGGRPHRLA
jgi:hypothetical protein